MRQQYSHMLLGPVTGVWIVVESHGAVKKKNGRARWTSVHTAGHPYKAPVGPIAFSLSEALRGLKFMAKVTEEANKSNLIERSLAYCSKNYLSTFTRCAHLKQRDMQVGQIAFLLRRAKGLIQQYLDLIDQCKSDKNMSYHLEELMRLGTGSTTEKKTPRRTKSC